MSSVAVGEAVYSFRIDDTKVDSDIKSAFKKVDSVASNQSSNAGKTSGRKFTEAFKAAFDVSVITKTIDRVFSAITKSVDTAVKRVDTLNNANKVFEAMGYTTDDVSASMETLKAYLDGLPTSMTDAVQGVQLLSASFDGIRGGTDYFIAMNDAGLAFGATTSQIQGAIMQLSQTSLDGPLDAQTWNSLRNSGFSPVFAAMAKEAGITVGELKEQFGGNGTKTVREFLDSLVRLDKEGTSSMESLSSLARKNTDGIGTAMENVQNRIGKAIAEVIDAIGAENIAGIIDGISSAFVEVGKAIAGVVNFLKENEAARTAFLAFLTTLGVIVSTLVVSAFIAWAAAMFANPITWIVLAVTALIAGLILLVTHIQEVGEFFLQIFGRVGDFVGSVATSIGQFFGDLFGSIGEGLSAVGEWFASVFTSIGSLVGGIVGGIVGAFQGAVSFITGIFQGLFNFFVSVFSNIGNFFSGVGKTIGDAVSGAFKTVVNAILGFVENIVNAPVKAINGLIDVINIVPGIGLGYLPTMSFPRLASGGIVPATVGGQIIMAGEAGEDEWVVPESKMASMIEQLEDRQLSTGGGITINVSGVFATSPSEQRKVAEQIYQRLQELDRARFGGVAI